MKKRKSTEAGTDNLNFKLTAQGYSEYFYSPELCHFTMTIVVQIHRSQTIHKKTFPYVITFNSTDRE